MFRRYRISKEGPRIFTQLRQKFGKDGHNKSDFRWVAIGSSHWIMTTILTSILGYVYWIAAARFFSAPTVGQTSVLVSVMLLATEFTHLGIGLGLAYVLPSAQDRWGSIVSSALTVVALLSGVLSLLFVVAARTLHLSIADGIDSVGSLIAFVSTCAISALALVLDQVLTIEKETALVLFRNTFSSICRLVSIALLHLFIPSDQGGLLFAAWGVSSGLSVLAVTLAFVLRNDKRRHLKFGVDLRVVQRLLPLSLANHLITSIETAASLLLPLIVASLISPEANAYYYIAWTVALGLFMIPGSISKILFANGAAAGTMEGQSLIRIMSTSTAILAPLVLVCILLREPVLALFGMNYARQSGPLLAVFALSAIPVGICGLYSSTMRIQRNFWRASCVAISVSVLGLGTATSWISGYGLLGAALAFFTAYTSVAILCVVDLGCTHYRKRSK